MRCLRTSGDDRGPEFGTPKISYTVGPHTRTYDAEDWTDLNRGEASGCINLHTD